MQIKFLKIEAIVFFRRVGPETIYAQNNQYLKFFFRFRPFFPSSMHLMLQFPTICVLV